MVTYIFNHVLIPHCCVHVNGQQQVYIINFTIFLVSMHLDSPPSNVAAVNYQDARRREVHRIAQLHRLTCLL
jgi:hypothetical protein